MADARPLIVDLDRSLTRADVAMESLVRVARRSVALCAALLWWMLAGRAGLKTRLARLDPVDPARLPYRAEVIALIQSARADGRPVWLASAAHGRNVVRVARHLGLFDGIIASTRRANIKGSAKLAAIRAAFPDTPFDYVGDSTADRPIWRAAQRAYTVGAPVGGPNEERLGQPPRGTARALLKAIRPHQWAKNSLVFVPLLTAGLLGHGGAICATMLAFACLSAIASGVYLLNDLLDIDADRQHGKKQHRPLASGDLTIAVAVVAAVVAVLGGLGAAWWWLGLPAFAALITYFTLTVAYSFRIKSAMIADVITLACLYTIRLVVGAAALGVPISSWLLLFSTFFFLSLGYLKRYIELRGSAVDGDMLLSGRGYVPSDVEIVSMSGISAGMVSLLVIALFADAMQASGQYAAPQLLWLLMLPLLYWFNRVWMMARRGQVDGDPVAFAIRDRRSIIVGAAMTVLVLCAKFVPMGTVLVALHPQ
ncbi:MAG: UbiA family prenyltransferase [Sphingopyxis sp.]